jgi:hypothetical protein
VSLVSNAPNSPAAIALSGTGVAATFQLTASPTSLSFSNLLVGTTSTQAVTLTNSGNSSVSVSQITVSGGGFSTSGLILPATLTAGQSTTLSVIFAPTVAGSVAGSVSVVSNATNSPATITLSGSGIQPALSVSPTILAFGNVLVGSSNTQTVTLTNSGSASLSISQATVTGVGFSVSGLTLPLSLAVGQSSSFSVGFAPTAAGSVTGSVSLVSNAPNSPATIALSATGVQPQLSITPTSVSFGSLVVGAKNTQTVTLTSSGTASLTISSATVSGAGFSLSGLTLPLTLAVGQSSSFSVAFAPAATGSLTGSVSLVSNAPGSPTAIGLSGTGVAASFLLTASPTSIAFGNVLVGSSSPQTVTVTNTGNSSVSISQINVSGVGFSSSGLLLPVTLTAGQSTTFSVLFAPTVAGSVTGSVSVVSNATNSPTTIGLSGSGLVQSTGLPICGKLNDANIHVPPNYDTFAPPAKGGSYTDPVFGCKITRVTDAAANGWVSAGHFYSLETPFNADDSYLTVLNTYNGGSWTIVDLSGNTVVPASNMPGTNTAAQPVWDVTNPKVFYYTSGQQLLKGTISGTAPNATVASTVLATFTQYSSVVIPDDVDLSSDGLHLWLADCYQNCTGSIFLVTLNAGNGTATSASQSTVMSGINHHGLTIVPNNGVFIDGTLYNSDGSLFGGTGTPAGGTSAHVDFGLDSSGRTVAASIWGQGTTNNGCPSNFGWSLLNLTIIATPLCLNNVIEDAGNANHVSMRDTNAKYWIAHSVDDSGTCPSSSYYCYNNPTSMSGWRLYTGEIIIWDGTGNMVRLAHHRSRSDETFWAQSRAAISRDGKYIAFDSNFNQSGQGANYADVYVIGPLY